jgi:urease gamma subunit
MYYWQKKFRRVAKDPRALETPIIPIIVRGATASSRGIGVKLPNGIQLILDDGVDLARLGTVVASLMEVGA